MDNLLFFDVESDNFLYGASNIWCIVGYDESRYHIYHEEDGWGYIYPKNTIIYNNIDWYMDYLSSKKLVGHNIISYDLPDY